MSRLKFDERTFDDGYQEHGGAITGMHFRHQDKHKLKVVERLKGKKIDKTREEMRTRGQRIND
jgi:DNA-binding transcriptional regulator YiaG